MSAVCLWLGLVLAWTDHPWVALAAVTAAYLFTLVDLRRLRRRVARPERLASPQNRERLPSALPRASSSSLGLAFNFLSGRGSR